MSAHHARLDDIPAFINHRIDNATGAVTVSEDDYHQARMLLAGQGLPRSAPDGNQVMNDLPLGASRAVEGERNRSARQMDLARTIEANLAKIAHIQLADNPNRNEPGTGEINYPFLYEFIDKIGYKGWIGAEYKPKSDTVAGLGWLPK